MKYNPPSDPSLNRAYFMGEVSKQPVRGGRVLVIRHARKVETEHGPDWGEYESRIPVYGPLTKGWKVGERVAVETRMVGKKMMVEKVIGKYAKRTNPSAMASDCYWGPRANPGYVTHGRSPFAEAQKRATASDKAHKIEEAKRYHRWDEVAKLEGWGRKPRQAKRKANPTTAEHAARAKSEGHHNLGIFIRAAKRALGEPTPRSELLDYYGNLRSVMGRVRQDAADGGLRYDEVPNWPEAVKVLQQLRERLSVPRENPKKPRATRHNPSRSTTLSREEFEKRYWGANAHTVPYATRREFYSDYRESGKSFAAYKRSTSMPADDYWAGRRR